MNSQRLNNSRTQLRSEDSKSLAELGMTTRCRCGAVVECDRLRAHYSAAHTQDYRKLLRQEGLMLAKERSARAVVLESHGAIHSQLSL